MFKRNSKFLIVEKDSCLVGLFEVTQNLLEIIQWILSEKETNQIDQDKLTKKKKRMRKTSQAKRLLKIFQKGVEILSKELNF